MDFSLVLKAALSALADTVTLSYGYKRDRLVPATKKRKRRGSFDGVCRVLEHEFRTCA